MKTVTKQSPNVKATTRPAHVCCWIVRINGQRAQVPATFRQFLGLIPSILPGNVVAKAVRS